MQRGIERAAWYLYDFAGDLLQPLRNGVAMHRLDGNDLQDQEI
jgi:hypothetical protein